MLFVLQANSVKNLDTPEDKLGWMFDAFDADCGGTVDADEITSIVTACTVNTPSLYRYTLNITHYTRHSQTSRGCATTHSTVQIQQCIPLDLLSTL